MVKIELAIQCDTDVATKLTAELTEVTREEVDRTELNNLDGSSTTLQVMQIAVSMVAAVAPIIAAYVGRKNVKKVKLGEIELENPTPEQVEYLWKEYLAGKRQESVKES